MSACDGAVAACILETDVIGELNNTSQWLSCRSTYVVVLVLSSLAFSCVTG